MAPRGKSGGGKKSEDLSIKVVIGPCRMSFPHFFEPQETDNGDRYQANFLFPPNWTKQPDFKKFEDALYDAMEDKFGAQDDWPRGRNDRGPKEVVRDADEKDYEGYKKGWYFIKAASRDPIGIVDANREEVTNPREIYGGRWCRISVTVKAYDNKSKGVGVYLNSVQVLDHDEPFGGRGPAKNDFEDWEGDALSNDDRGTGRGNARPRDDDRDDDRGSRRGRDRDDDDKRDDRRSRDDDRGSSRRGRDDEDDAPRGSRRDRDRDDRDDRDDDRRPSRRGDDDKPRSRDRDDDNRDDRRGRGRDADDRDDRRPSRRDRDDEEDRSSRRGSSRDDRDRDAEDDDRPSRGRRSRDEPEDDRGDDRPSRRGSSRSRDDDDKWN